MHFRVRNLSLLAGAVLVLILPPAYLLMAERRSAAADPAQVLIEYLRVTYARDFGAAYRLISAEDRRWKDERSYIRERGAFTGFTLEVARRLARLIEATPTGQKIDANRAHLNLKLKLPDANKLSNYLQDWDEDRLNALPSQQQKALDQTIDQWSKEGKIPLIEGEQSFDLVKEAGRWKLYLDWADGVEIDFRARVSDNLPLEVKWEQDQVRTRPNELFNVHFRIKNVSNQEVFTKIPHRIEPKDMKEYLELVECGLFSPMKLSPREEQEYASTYLLRGDLPDRTRRLAVTYEFDKVP